MSPPTITEVCAAGSEWLKHVHPIDGDLPCTACMLANAPKAGCAEGRRLYLAYTAAKVEHSSSKV